MLKVHDDGPGVAADIQPKVFERFTRADRRRKLRNQLCQSADELGERALRLLHVGSLIAHPASHVLRLLAGGAAEA